MNRVLLLTDILIIIFEIYLYIDFSSEFMKVRTITKKAKLSVLIIWVSMIYVTITFDNLFMNLFIIPCIYFGISFLVFNASLGNRCLYTLIFFSIISGVGGCFYIALDIILSRINIEMIYSHNNMLGYVLILKMVTLVVIKFLKDQMGYNKNRMSKSTLMYVWPLLVSTFLIYGGIFYLNIHSSILLEAKGVLILGCVGILFSDTLVFYIIGRLRETMNRAKLLELEKMKEKLNEIYYKKLSEKNIIHAQIIHNLNYYFETIGKLAIDNKCGEILKILEGIDIQINDGHIYSYCSNIILNAILTEKSLQAKVLDIKFDIFVEPSLNVESIKDIDLISIFGNLISNAIEATQKCENKCIKIQLYMTNKNRFIMFKLENTFIVSPKRKGIIFETIKINKEKHGIGLEHVRKILESYGGDLCIEIHDNIFNVTAMFSV